MMAITAFALRHFRDHCSEDEDEIAAFRRVESADARHFAPSTGTHRRLAPEEALGTDK